MKIILLILLSSIYLDSICQHTVVLKSGDKIEGVVMSLNNDVWEVYVEGKEHKIQMKEVSSVFFNEFVPYDGALVPQSEEKTITVNGFTVKYQIEGRTMIRKPEVSIGSEDKGTIVVKVVVDRYGHILSAEPEQPGTTTSNTYLNTKAMKAAKTAKFNESLKGPLKTEGLITIIY